MHPAEPPARLNSEHMALSMSRIVQAATKVQIAKAGATELSPTLCGTSFKLPGFVAACCAALGALS
eukprot:311228-Prymnesium_polylepis.1